VTKKEYDVLIVGSGHSGGYGGQDSREPRHLLRHAQRRPGSGHAARPHPEGGLRPSLSGFGKPGRLSTFSRPANSTPINGWMKPRSLHLRAASSLQLGARAAAGRQIAVLVAPILSLERFRIQRRGNRRLRHKLADPARRYCAVLFAVEEIFRVAGRKEAGPSFPTATSSRPLPRGQPDPQAGHGSMQRARLRRFENAHVAGRGRARQLHQSAVAGRAGHGQARNRAETPLCAKSA